MNSLRVLYWNILKIFPLILLQAKAGGNHELFFLNNGREAFPLILLQAKAGGSSFLVPSFLN